MAESMSEVMNPNLARERDEAFPHAPQDWSRGQAEAQAVEEGLALVADHWEAVAALQEYFERNREIHIRKLHDALDERFHARGGMKHLYRMFPGGPVAQGCRISGLEAPAGTADSSFGSVQ